MTSDPFFKAAIDANNGVAAGGGPIGLVDIGE